MFLVIWEFFTCALSGFGFGWGDCIVIEGGRDGSKQRSFLYEGFIRASLSSASGFGRLPLSNLRLGLGGEILVGLSSSSSSSAVVS